VRSNINRTARIGPWVAFVTVFGLATPATLGQWPIPNGHQLVDGLLVPDEPLAPDQIPTTGLQKRFPKMLGADANPTTPAKVALGRLLFFDPIVSGKNDMSCAHCHHPDTGLTDRLQKGRGIGATGAGPNRTGGLQLNRNTPTLWNVAYHPAQFWDNRAKTLEDQAQAVITNPNEMAADPHQLVRELKSIQEYVRMFEAAFAGPKNEAITFKKVTQAIAAFERTLVTFNSKFDRYAAGDLSALTKTERRGMLIFRSVKTRCFECHGVPTFSSPVAKVVGLPDKDEDPAFGRLFKVPGLRNIALTAPYMHDGSKATLGDVIDFYAKGGGRGAGRPMINQDGFVLGFDLTAQEKSDLIAFLHTLTDTSLQVSIPSRVPSGLPVVPRIRTAEQRAAKQTAKPIAEQREPTVQVASASTQAALAAVASTLAAETSKSPTGKVTGIILYDGKAPASWRPKPPPSVGEKFTKDTVVDLATLKPPQPIAVNENGGVQDVVVALINDDTPQLTPKTNAKPPLIDQRGGVFVPNITVIPPGGQITFHNSDAINHNVHLMSPKQKEHNFLSTPDATSTIEFSDTPEDLVNVVCDMHAWMRAQIVVVPTPFYAVTDDHGRFTIDHVPPGTYSVKLVHKRLANADENLTVKVAAGKTTTLEAKAKRARRRRRQ